MQYQGANSGQALHGVLGLFSIYRNGNYRLLPDRPGLVAVSPEKTQKFYGTGGIGVPANEGPDGGGNLTGSLSNEQMVQLQRNVMLHELSHSLLENNHCGDWSRTRNFDLVTVRDKMTASFIMRPAPSRFWGGDLSEINTLERRQSGGWKVFRTPWHSMWEINAMREQLGLPLWRGVGHYDMP